MHRSDFEFQTSVLLSSSKFRLWRVLTVESDIQNHQVFGLVHVRKSKITSF
jgi:hypothetical protein